MAGEILEQLSEDLRANEAFAQMNTANDLAKGLLDYRGKVGEFEGKVKEYEGKYNDLKNSTIPKLPADASPEEREVYALALGRPEKKDAYNITSPAEGVPVDADFVEYAKDMFFKNNITQEQAQGLATMWNEYIGNYVKKSNEDAQKAVEQADADLKKEYGDKYNERVELARRFVSGILKINENPKFKDFLENTRTEDGVALGNNPTLIRILVNAAQAIGEDRFAQGSQNFNEKVKEGMIYSKSPQPPKN